MDDDPESKKQFPEQWAPRLGPIVDGVRDPGHNPNQVDDQDGCGRDQKCCPFEGVQFSEFLVVYRLGSDGEIRVDSGQHLQQALHDGEEVRGHAADDPELLVPPPFLDAHSAPPQLENARGEDGEEESYEEQTCQGAYLVIAFKKMKLICFSILARN